MQSLTSLDIKKLIDEISYINNGFIRNIKSGKNELYFLIYNGREYWLKIIPGSYICLQNEKPTDSVEFGFTSLLKSALKGKKMSISMHNSDRIIEIETNNNKLIIEMFSKGNVILLENGKIKRALFQRKFESRTIESNKEYEYPPGEKLSFEEMLEKFEYIIKESEKESIVKCLAIDFSLGGNYAEEVCFRANVNKSEKTNEISSSEILALKTNLSEILKENKPNIINKEVLSVIDLKHIEGEKEYFPSVNEAVKAFFENGENKKSYNPIKAEVNKARERVNEYQKYIDYINENYEKIKNAIAILRDSSKEINERIRELKSRGFEVNGKEISPSQMQDLKIDITNDLRYTLSNFYEKAKRLKKVDIQKIPNKIDRVKKLKVITGNEWYTKFRFFTTSLGKLCVIGKDVNQNESLIQKHLEKNDLVGHADIFGSPFGIIKAGSQRIEKKDMEEMASMIASYSSAWKANATNLDVYFVKPEQVTKNPPSGEFLKKGAFYIEGKREYIKNARLGIYLSFTFDEETVKIEVTPYEINKTFFLLKPGNKKRDEIIRKINRMLAQKYGFEINRDYIDKLIPQGKSSLEKSRLL